MLIGCASFRNQILGGYGVRIQDKSTEIASAYQHFDREPCSREWYQEKHRDSSIWLSLNEDQAQKIVKRYQHLDHIEANEAKYAHHGRTHFFKDDEIEREPESRERKSYFELEWGPKPQDSDNLFCPPMIDGKYRPLSFDSNPDCSYWLTLQRLNESYRRYIQDWTYVKAPSDVAAPYLTIEFKKAPQKTLADAVNQLAITLSLTLFNRVLLRCQRLTRQHRRSSSWTPNDFGDIKHYGIAFSANIAHIYVAQPILSFKKFGSIKASSMEDPLKHPWVGCTLERLQICNVVRPQEVIELSEWINEIHHWGMDSHSSEFELDVKAVIYFISKDKSRVSLSSEDIRRLGLE
ncbi:MAG: hypothetical protein Q9162_007886 [Coniocarpon cinnabarinum]